MTSVSRAHRVAGLIQELISNLLHRDISDPRLQMVTITQVQVTKDLRIARVYFASAGGKDRAEETAHGFKSASGFIKRQLGPLLGLRYVPELQFYYDESFDRGARIDQLLKSIGSDSHGPDHSTD